ncbi:hypothetical protein Trydic_g20553 [Trypoxylus dichotomus]
MSKFNLKLKRKHNDNIPGPSNFPSKDIENEDDDGYFNTIEGEDADSSDSDGEFEEESENEELSEDYIDSSSEVSGEEEEAIENEEESDVGNEGSEEEVEEDKDDFEEIENEGSDMERQSDSDSGSINLSENKEQKIRNTMNNEEESGKFVKIRNETVNSNSSNDLIHFRTKTKVKDAVNTAENDEYADHDTSDEEDIRNTVGNIPMKWYNDYKHLGYDWDGKQIIKPETGDRIDDFLKRMENPEFWRTVKDPQTGQDVVLNDDDIQLIKRIQAQKIPDVSFDEYAPWIEWFTSEVMKTPIRKFPEHKRSFLPSKNEQRKISKLVHALKMGWIKTKAEQDALRAKKEPQFYMLWASDDQAEEMRRIHKHIAPPKRHLPGHAESYNPPAEYLFDEKELKQWNKQKNDPSKRKLHFVPQKYDSLRKVPAYSRYIKERFLRCLDLYLCPRAIKMKLTIEPDALVPKLPSPKDLQPFPVVLCIEYEGHKDMVRTISPDPTGQYLASGSDDHTVKIWEVNTGRCLKTIDTNDIVRCVQWCPNTALSLIAVASGNRLLLVNPHVGDFLICSKTDTVLKEASETISPDTMEIPERVRNSVKWEDPSDDEYQNGIRVCLKHFKEITQVAWHCKGDYFSTVMPDGQNRSVLISQLSKRRSQIPFSKSKGLVQSVLFHPLRPLLFVATQRHVRIYDLVKQQLVKKLMTNSKWISTMAIHPGGDNLLVATYDRKVLWFDLDLSTKPYQTLRLHGTAVRGVAYHKRYPLFASGSDDRSLIVSHGMVYNDLLKNPLIVPLKRFQDHKPHNDFGVFDVKFHPLQPWVFSSGGDGTIKLYSN